MSEFIIETEEFNIRKVMDSDYEAFGKIAAAEYLFGRMYEIDPELAKKFTGILDMVVGSLHRKAAMSLKEVNC
ncbi:MAG: hypothetical protein ACLUTV_11510 [Dorea longicatena]